MKTQSWTVLNISVSLRSQCAVSAQANVQRTSSSVAREKLYTFYRNQIL